MKNNSKSKKYVFDKVITFCANCWGHQEYNESYVPVKKDLTRSKYENFISKFVKTYILKA